jgi:ribonuclease HI
MSHLVTYADGSSHGSPGPSGIGVIVEESAGGRSRILVTSVGDDGDVTQVISLQVRLVQ